MSLLHFFVRSLLRMRQDFDTRLCEQLPGMREAARLSWAGLREGLSQLRSDAGFVASEAKESTATYGPEPTQHLSRFATRATEAAAEAAAAIEVANGALAELARYFGVRDANATSRPGDPKEPPGLTILCQLSELLVGFLRTCEEVRESPEDWIATDTEKQRGSASRRLGSASPCRASEVAFKTSAPVISA